MTYLCKQLVRFTDIFGLVGSLVFTGSIGVTASVLFTGSLGFSRIGGFAKNGKHKKHIFLKEFCVLL